MKVTEIAKQYLLDKACSVCVNYDKCHKCFEESWNNCPKLTHFLAGFSACLDEFADKIISYDVLALDREEK